MDSFVANRKLLNPKFEGYKFDFIDQDDVVSRFPLPTLASQATISSRTLLSFQEVQSRISHNHLTVFGGQNRAIFVDEGGNVVLIDIASDTLLPSFKIVYELPKSISTTTLDRHHEYPSAAFLPPDLLFLSDGHGSMYLLRVSDTTPFQHLATYQFIVDKVDQPFRIHSVDLISSKTAVVISSSRNYETKDEPTKPSGKERKATPAEFDVWAMKFDLSTFEPSDQIRNMDILWHRRGDDVPILTSFDVVRNTFMLIGGSSYRDIATVSIPSYEPSSDELAPIPRPNENLDISASDPAKPPPYSWTQTSDSVTVAFPLPSTTAKSGIHVNFTSESLSMVVEGNPADAVVPLPKYSSKVFWDRISSSSSYWTWDREAEHSFGILTLHLDKQHEGTKWMHVFASAGASAASELSPEDVEVPETLDPSELWMIRESLEKYTAALRSGEDASGLGLGKGVPSLGEGEMDEDVDSSVGRTAYVSWVGCDGSSPSWSRPGLENPFQLLSTPLPGVSSPFSLIVKENLDGTVFEIEAAQPLSDMPPKWAHVSTFSALAFVLASKQDVRFTHHVQDAVLAFENGLRDRGGNMYVYRRAAISQAWAKQTILKVGDGAGGALLGVGAIKVQNSNVVLGLMEKQLIVIKMW